MSIQDQPVEDGSTDATHDDKIAGIVEQTRQDVAVGSIDASDVDSVLEQRFADASLDLGEDERRRWAAAAVDPDVEP